jgi:threonine dehydrogenase-like Zn-dependent dehydrogenase
LSDILEGRIEPGKVFDRNVGLDGIPDGYWAMADRESIKVMVTPKGGWEGERVGVPLCRVS